MIAFQERRKCILLSMYLNDYHISPLSMTNDFSLHLKSVAVQNNYKHVCLQTWSDNMSHKLVLFEHNWFWMSFFFQSCALKTFLDTASNLLKYFRTKPKSSLLHCNNIKEFSSDSQKNDVAPSFSLSLCSTDVHRHPDHSRTQHQTPSFRDAGVPGFPCGGTVHLTHWRQHYNAGKVICISSRHEHIHNKV